MKLLDWTGRQVRAAGSGSSQRGAIPSKLQPIVGRPRIVGDFWLDIVRHFGRWFDRAFSSAENVPSAAARAGKRWFSGIVSRRQASSKFLARSLPKIFSTFSAQHATPDYAALGAAIRRKLAVSGSPVANRLTAFGHPCRRRADLD